MGSRRDNGSGSRLNGAAAAVAQSVDAAGSPAPAVVAIGAGLSSLDELEATVAVLRRANEALERENARLARAAWSQSGSAAAVRITRAERSWLERAELAELEAARLGRLLATPRHLAVEQAREKMMRTRPLYAVVRRLWAWTARG